MKTIRSDELYQNVGGFLKSKGIELTDGSCPKAVKTGCELLADAINISQRGIQRTREKIDQNLELLRQAIHEMTSPRPPKASPNMQGTPSPADKPTSTVANLKPEPAAKKKAARRHANTAAAKPKARKITKTRKTGAA